MRETRTSGLMSGDGKRSDWQGLKPPRPSSTLLAQSGLRVSRLGALTAAVLAAMPATAALAAVDGGEPRHERTLCTGRSDIPWDRQISSCTALPLSPLAPVINLFGRPGDDFARATR
jgi:hypothetical protein